MAGQREMAEVIGAELHLEAVVRVPQRQEHHAGVVAEDVDAAVARGDVGGEAPDRCEIGEVERIDFDPGGRMEPADCVRGLGGARGIAAAHHDGRALGGQRFRDLPAEAAIGAGHDRDFAALRRDVARAPCMHVCLHRRGRCATTRNRYIECCNDSPRRRGRQAGD